MNPLLRTFLVLSAIVLLSQCEKESLNVSIPDSNFIDELVKQGIDKNGDKNISFDEAEAVTSLTIRNIEISNLKGIEAFTNLEELYCDNNKLTSLDLSGNKKLKYLDCSNNELSTLDVSKNTYLVEIYCNGNNLDTLDLRKQLFLETK